jgi:hypothetical protein
VRVGFGFHPRVQNSTRTRTRRVENPRVTRNPNPNCHPYISKTIFLRSRKYFYITIEKVKITLFNDIIYIKGASLAGLRRCREVSRSSKNILTVRSSSIYGYRSCRDGFVWILLATMLPLPHSSLETLLWWWFIKKALLPLLALSPFSLSSRRLHQAW